MAKLLQILYDVNIEFYGFLKALVEGVYLSDSGDGHYLDHWSFSDRS